MLVFEDLRYQQFKSADRMYGLDTEHMKLTLENLAKWHAGTATLLLTVHITFILFCQKDYCILKIFPVFVLF